MRISEKIWNQLRTIPEEDIVLYLGSSHFAFPFSEGEVIAKFWLSQNEVVILGKSRKNKKATLWKAWQGDPWNPSYLGFLDLQEVESLLMLPSVEESMLRELFEADPLPQEIAKEEPR